MLINRTKKKKGELRNITYILNFKVQTRYIRYILYIYMYHYIVIIKINL